MRCSATCNAILLVNKSAEQDKSRRPSVDDALHGALSVDGNDDEYPARPQYEDLLLSTEQSLATVEFYVRDESS